MSAEQIAFWTGLVVGLVELVKFSGVVPDRWGIGVAALVSALAVGVEVVSTGYDGDLRGYVAGWALILFSAAGVFGFVRSVRPEAAMTMRRPMALVLALAMTAGASVGCGAKRVDPVLVATSASADVLVVVDAAQSAVTTYAAAHGGRTAATDRIMAGIRDHVLPSAQQVELLVTRYQALGSIDLRDATIDEIEIALAQLEGVAVEVFGAEAIPPGLAPQLAVTVSRVRELTAAIRAAMGRG